MKTLTNKQIKQLLETGAFTKSGKIHGGMAFSIDNALTIAAKGDKVYYMNSGGPRKPITESKGSLLAADILKACGYKVVFGNDAPRGGQLGNYFKLTRKAKISTEEVERQVLNFVSSK